MGWWDGEGAIWGGSLGYCREVVVFGGEYRQHEIYTLWIWVWEGHKVNLAGNPYF